MDANEAAEIKVRLERIEKILGLRPFSDDEEKAAAQARWIANQTPWLEEWRKRRAE